MVRFDPMKYATISNNQIADMLKFYNLYATTAAVPEGMEDKPSGPELLRLIAYRLGIAECHTTRRTTDAVNETDTYLTVIGERLRPGPDMAYVDLNVIQEHITEGSNFLRELGEAIASCNKPPVVDRKPGELAAEATMWLMEHNIFKHMCMNRYMLYAQKHGGVICSKYQVIATGKDWFITCVPNEQTQAV